MIAYSTVPAPGPAAPIDSREIEEIVSSCRGLPGELLTTLERLQQRNRYNYLPREALVEVGKALRIPFSQVFSVATFYAFFNLEPQGEHTVSICRGTACHTRGSRALLEFVKQKLNIFDDPEAEDGDKADKANFTTADRKFTIRTVACFGQCAMAPVVELDHHIYGNMNRQALGTAVEDIEHEDKQR